MARPEILNPFRPLLSETEASFAARAGAVGALLTAASSVVTTLFMLGKRDAMRALMLDSAHLNAADPEVARASIAATEMGLDFFMGISVAMALAYLVFGLIQWFRRTRVIPLVMLLLCLFSLLTSVLGLFSPRTAAQAAFIPPAWQLALSWMLVGVNLVLFWAGVRGGGWLEKARKAAPTAPDPPASSAR